MNNLDHKRINDQRMQGKQFNGVFLFPFVSLNIMLILLISPFIIMLWLTMINLLTGGNKPRPTYRPQSTYTQPYQQPMKQTPRFPSVNYAQTR